jgi:hypothetical protein
MKLLQATTRNRRVAFLILLPAVVSILGVPANAKANEVIEAFENCARFDSAAKELECFRDTLERLRTRMSGGSESGRRNASPIDGAPMGQNRTQQTEPPSKTEANASTAPSGDQAGTSESASSEDRASAASGSGVRSEGTHGSHAQTPDDLQQPGGLTVKSARRTAFGKLIVVLDNEETWIEVDGSHYKGKVRPGDVAVITKRRFGGYRMKINDQPGTVLVRLAK